MTVIETNQENKLLLSKIRTGVPGLDELFYGGLRMPSTTEKPSGVCIAIYGERGASKVDLAMQIMFGVSHYIDKHYKNGLRRRFFTLNHREQELQKKYIGLQVSHAIERIKLPVPHDEDEYGCDLCRLFPALREGLSGIDLPEFDTSTRFCHQAKMNQCQVCRLIRHEVINYNARSQSLYWTEGNKSDSSNLLARLDHSCFQPLAEKIFGKDIDKEILSSGSYYTNAHLRFKQVQKEIFDQVRKIPTDNGEEEKLGDSFYWSSMVIEGFTSFKTDELSLLPFDDLIRNLRATSAISILVLDERGQDLHLNADILINLRQIHDASVHRIAYELSIAKSDLQDYVHGWHRYRSRHDLIVEVFQNLHSVVKQRFETSNATLRLEQKDMRFAQNLLERFRYLSEIKRDESSPADVIASILSDKKKRTDIYDPENEKTYFHLVEADDCAGLYNSVFRQLQQNDTTVVVLLFGKSEQWLRKRLCQYSLSDGMLSEIHYWPLNIGCIAPDELIAKLKLYLLRWRQKSDMHCLHLIFDDFANIGLYPLLNREVLFLPALMSICQKVTALRGFEGNKRGISLQVSFVCTDKDAPRYKELKQIIDNQ